MLDFTLNTYITLLDNLKLQDFSFLTFEEYMIKPAIRCIILRHDADLLPRNSLQFARIQADKGIRATYFFRTITESYNEKIIKEIALLGHEIGYHYEDVSLAAERLRAEGRRQKRQGEEFERKLAEIGIESFKKNLEKLRKIVPVKTICMHGSPMSRWDSRLLWKYYDYPDFGIIGEPYFDINFNEVLYLTDTGRRWDGNSVNIRDKAEGGRRKAEGKAEGSRLESTLQPSAFSPQPPVPFPSFHSTFDIINAAEEGKLPDKIMMTFHPQRWTDDMVPWIKELVWQNVKNVGKYLLIRLRA